MKRALYTPIMGLTTLSLAGCAMGATSQPAPTVTVVQQPTPTVTVTVDPSAQESTQTSAAPSPTATPKVAKLGYGQRKVFVIPADDGTSTTRLGVAVKPPVMMKSLNIGDKTLRASDCPTCVLALVNVQTSIIDTAATVDMGKTMRLGDAAPLSVDKYAGRIAKVEQKGNFLMTSIGDDVYTFDPQYGEKNDVAFVFKLKQARLPNTVTWKLGDETAVWSADGSGVS